MRFKKGLCILLCCIMVFNTVAYTEKIEARAIAGFDDVLLIQLLLSGAMSYIGTKQINIKTPEAVKKLENNIREQSWFAPVASNFNLAIHEITSHASPEKIVTDFFILNKSIVNGKEKIDISIKDSTMKNAVSAVKNYADNGANNVTGAEFNDNVIDSDKNGDAGFAKLIQTGKPVKSYNLENLYTYLPVSASEFKTYANDLLGDINKYWYVCYANKFIYCFPQDMAYVAVKYSNDNRFYLNREQYNDFIKRRKTSTVENFVNYYQKVSADNKFNAYCIKLDSNNKLTFLNMNALSTILSSYSDIKYDDYIYINYNECYKNGARFIYYDMTKSDVDEMTVYSPSVSKKALEYDRSIAPAMSEYTTYSLSPDLIQNGIDSEDLAEVKSLLNMQCAELADYEQAIKDQTANDTLQRVSIMERIEAVPKAIWNYFGDAITDIRTGVKAIATTANPDSVRDDNNKEDSSSGSFLDATLALLAILLILLKIFLHCMEFIVNVFKIPASPGFIVGDFATGFEYIKNVEIKGMGMSVYDFMMALVHLVVFFAIIKMLKGHIDKMKEI